MSDLIFPPFAPVPPRPEAPLDAAAAPVAPEAPAPVPAVEAEGTTQAHPAFGSGAGVVDDGDAMFGMAEGMLAPEDAVGAADRGPATGSLEELMPWDSPAPVAPLTPEDVVGAEPAAGEDAEDEAGDDEAEDLPWLEMPAREPREVVEPEAPAVAAGPPPSAEAVPQVGGDEETPDWMAWAGPEVVGGGPEETTESPELPSPGAGAGAAARAEAPAAGEEAQAPASVADVTAFGRSDLETVPPVMGLAPVGDFTFPDEGGPASPSPSDASSRYRPEPEPEEPEWERPAMAAPVRAASAGVPEGVAAALGEVADRLERIARDLRERPEAVLSGAHAHGGDALGLLVTGFALGCAQRGGER